MKRLKRIIAVIMAVLIVIGTANFMPEIEVFAAEDSSVESVVEPTATNTDANTEEIGITNEVSQDTTEEVTEEELNTKEKLEKGVINYLDLSNYEKRALIKELIRDYQLWFFSLNDEEIVNCFGINRIDFQKSMVSLLIEQDENSDKTYIFALADAFIKNLFGFDRAELEKLVNKDKASDSDSKMDDKENVKTSEESKDEKATESEPMQGRARSFPTGGMQEFKFRAFSLFDEEEWEEDEYSLFGDEGISLLAGMDFEGEIYTLNVDNQNWTVQCVSTGEPATGLIISPSTYANMYLSCIDGNLSSPFAWSPDYPTSWDFTLSWGSQGLKNWYANYFKGQYPGRLAGGVHPSEDPSDPNVSQYTAPVPSNFKANKTELKVTKNGISYDTEKVTLNTASGKIVTKVTFPADSICHYQNESGGWITASNSPVYVPNGKEVYFTFASHLVDNVQPIQFEAYSDNVAAGVGGERYTKYYYIDKVGILNPLHDIEGWGIQRLAFPVPTTASYSLPVTGAEHKGDIELDKKSMNPQVSDGNACYSLANAEYSVYKTEADANSKKNVFKTITTDANGNGKLTGLDYGTYYVRETKAPKGYKLDNKVYNVTVNDNTTAIGTKAVKLSVKDDTEMDPAVVEVYKAEELNGQINRSKPLQGAEFTIKYYDNANLSSNGSSRTWTIITNETGYAELAKDFLKSGSSELYKDSKGAVGIPEGWITIEETKAPNGYLRRTDVKKYTIIKDANGNYPSITIGNNINGNDYFGNTPSKGDLSFYKKEAGTNNPIANVKFEIRNKDTNEAHIVWTDANGYYSTASSFAPHSKNTNKGNPGDGVWFSGDNMTLDDSIGALPAGKYVITELRCEANINKYKTIAPIEVTVDGGATVDLGTILNKKFPTITTKAWDKDTLMNYASDKQVVDLVDTCHFTDLEIGHSYIIKGWPMKTPTEKVEGYDSEFKFTATDEVMDIDVPYSFDRKDAEQFVTFYEYLYDDNYPDELISSHEDFDDEAQRIYFIEIKTKAHSKDSSSHIVEVSADAKAYDDVYYNGIVFFEKEYLIKAVAMDTKTGLPLVVNGKELTAEKIFEPKENSGIETIELSVDSSELQGVRFTFYEYIYVDGKLVASHTDLNEAEQQIVFGKLLSRATDSQTKTRVGVVGPDSCIEEELFYNGFNVGEEVTVDTYLVYSDDKTEVVIDGKPVKVTGKYTAEKEDGSFAINIKLDSSSLGGKSVTVCDKVYDKDGKLILSHTDIVDEQTIHYPSVTTTAMGIPGTHMVPVDGIASSVDYAKYTNLVCDGTKYTIKGKLMNVDTGEPFLDENGNVITAEKEFVPEQPNGTEPITFTFPANLLQGKITVAYEDIYVNNIRVCGHTELTDLQQRLFAPSLETIARAEDGSKELEIGKQVKDIDTCMYSNLATGHYELVGTVMIKETNKELMENGKAVTSTVQFDVKAKDEFSGASGSIDNVFTFTTTDEMSEMSLVTYEDIYYVAEDGTRTLVISERDINNGGQTVKVKKKTTPPPTPPTTPPTPKTGDNTPIILIIIGLVGSFGALVLLRKKKKMY